MATYRRPRRVFGAVFGAAAALALALTGCGPDGSDTSDEPTAVEAPTAQGPSDSGGEDGTSAAGPGAGFSPLGVFPALSLTPMGGADSAATVVESGELAGLAAELTQSERSEVACDSTLRAGGATPVTCTLSSASAQATAYPVHGGATGAEDHVLLVDGELDRAQAEVVMDPEVSSHLGPTALFFDDPSLLAPEGLPERVQAELESLGVKDRVDTCEGIPGGNNGHAGVRCVGTQDVGGIPFEVQLYPTFTEGSSPAALALVHRPSP